MKTETRGKVDGEGVQNWLGKEGMEERKGWRSFGVLKRPIFVNLWFLASSVF